MPVSRHWLIALLGLSPPALALEWQPAQPTPASPVPEPAWAAPAPQTAPLPPGWEPLTPSEAQPAAAPLPWQLVPTAEVIPAPEAAEPPAPPRSLAEVQELLDSQLPTWADYRPLLQPLRIGQLPTAVLLPDDQLQFSAQQVSPTDGGAAGGTGVQNYAVRGELMLNPNLMVSGFWTYADDPLYKPITGPAGQPSSSRDNLWVVWGGSARARLLAAKGWSLAAEGSLEQFSVGSGCSSPESCSGSAIGSANIFNASGQKVYSNNLVGSLALPLSWQATPALQLTFTPLVAFLPSQQGGGQGGAGSFYGTNIGLGLGASYQLGNQVQLFSSALFPLGPGDNAFDSSLSFTRVPIYSIGTLVALNPRIGLEARVSNGYGLSPATAILALPSAPYEPMVAARLVWNPVAPDSPQPAYTPRQASLALGGLSVNTALTPVGGTTQLWTTADSSGSLWGGAAYSVSNDLQAQILTGAVESGDTPNSYVDTYVGDGDLNVRFGAKAMVFRPTKALPVWLGGRVTAGRAGGGLQAEGAQGNLFAELMGSWEATPKLAFHLNPKLSWSGSGTSWGVGLAANLQLAKRLQLLSELNLVATDLGGSNGSNASLGLRWLASAGTTVDLYISNAMGMVDLTQLLSSEELRLGAKLTVQF